MNATGHLVLETANYLLQHWPNMHYCIGHTIVPGTLLYHGSKTGHIPISLEDIERVTNRLADTLVLPLVTASGIDRRMVFQLVVDQYAAAWR